MGWVEKRFRAEEAYGVKAGELWDTLRDAVGEAVEEFSERTPKAPVEASDCQAKGRYCIRVRKVRGPEVIEIFLNEADKTVELQLGAAASRQLCRYSVNEDCTALAFVGDMSSQPLSAEDICKQALEEFLFPQQR